jgi:hypothetical protein
MSQVLLERILDAFPKTFLTHLLERQTALYQMALGSVRAEQPWTDAEAFDLLPHWRRAIFESELRKAAVSCNLKARNVLHNGENCNCVTIEAKTLVLTAHFVNSPKEFVRDAESRKQNAGVNRWLTHYVDERLLTSPVPKVDNRQIYVNLLHGAVFPTSKKQDRPIDPVTCFLHFAIPAADSKEYLAGCNWSAQELLRHYASADSSAYEPIVTIADRAQPVVKKKA